MMGIHLDDDVMHTPAPAGRKSVQFGGKSGRKALGVLDPNRSSTSHAMDGPLKPKTPHTTKKRAPLGDLSNKKAPASSSHSTLKPRTPHSSKPAFRLFEDTEPHTKEKQPSTASKQKLKQFTVPDHHDFEEIEMPAGRLLHEEEAIMEPIRVERAHREMAKELSIAPDRDPMQIYQEQVDQELHAMFGDIDVREHCPNEQVLELALMGDDDFDKILSNGIERPSPVVDDFLSIDDLEF